MPATTEQSTPARYFPDMPSPPVTPFAKVLASSAGGARSLCLLLALAAPACSSDIFDVSVELMAEAFHVDFGTSSGSIPNVPCTNSAVAMCGAGQVLALMDDAGEVSVMPGCDASTSRCFVQANAVVRYTVDVLKDESFTSKVARKSVSAVRMLDISYTIPNNTTTFEIPGLDVAVGPAGSRMMTDPGVYLVDTVESLPAGTVVSGERRHLTVMDGSPARNLIESSIKAKTPFVFMLTMAPRLNSGATVPAGMLDVEIKPLLGLGLR